MECQICFNEFDVDQCLPKVLKCGHSYCLRCINNLSERSYFGRGSVCCALCRTSSTSDEVQTNYALLELLHQRMEPQPTAPPLNEMRRCGAHNEEIDAFCDTCSTFLCRLCYQASTSDHSSHIRLSLEGATQLIVGLTQNRLQIAQEQRKLAQERLRYVDASLEEQRNKLVALEQKGLEFFTRCQEQVQMQHERFNIDVMQHFDKISNAHARRTQYFRLRASEWEQLERQLQSVADKGATLGAIETLVDCGDALPERIDGSWSTEASACDLSVGMLEFCPKLGCIPQLYSLYPVDDDPLPPDLQSSMATCSLADNIFE